jgi:hypothetical protein
MNVDRASQGLYFDGAIITFLLRVRSLEPRYCLHVDGGDALGPTSHQF